MRRSPLGSVEFILPGGDRSRVACRYLDPLAPLALGRWRPDGIYPGDGRLVDFE